MKEMAKNALPLNVWYPMSVEPDIGENIIFVPRSIISKYANTTGDTGVKLWVPNELCFGSYVGNKYAEISPYKPAVRVGVWFPLPLFFFESSIKTITDEQLKRYMNK